MLRNIVIIATGVLHDNENFHPEKSWRDINGFAMEKVLKTNMVGPALLGKYFLPLLDKNRKSVFAALSARVGSIEDNRLGGWYSYRASKAALNMLLKNFAIELSRRNPYGICLGLHPGTVDTDLSKPFQGSIKKENLFTPELAAIKMLSVIDGVSQKGTDLCFAWDGKTIPF